MSITVIPLTSTNTLVFRDEVCVVKGDGATLFEIINGVYGSIPEGVTFEQNWTTEVDKLYRDGELLIHASGSTPMPTAVEVLDALGTEYIIRQAEIEWVESILSGDGEYPETLADVCFVDEDADALEQ